MRHNTNIELLQFGKLITQQFHNESAQSRPRPSRQRLYLKQTLHIILLLKHLLDFPQYTLPNSRPMHITPIRPVIPTPLLLHYTVIFVVFPGTLSQEVFGDDFGLHVDEKGFGGGGLGGREEIGQHGLVAGGGFYALVEHTVEEGLSDLVAALAQLDEWHCHYNKMWGWRQKIEIKKEIKFKQSVQRTGIILMVSQSSFPFSLILTLFNCYYLHPLILQPTALPFSQIINSNQCIPSIQLQQMKRANAIRLMRQEQQLLKDPIEFACVRRKDNLKFHFCLFGLGDDYQGGYYHGVLNLPEQYPFSPPELRFFTPSGYFQIDKAICTTFTNYHKQTWSAIWNVESMVLGTISFMLAGDQSVGVNICTPEVKRKCAMDSMKFNMANPEFMELFSKEKFVEKYLEKAMGQEKKAVENPEPQELPKQKVESANTQMEIEEGEIRNQTGNKVEGVQP